MPWKLMPTAARQPFRIEETIPLALRSGRRASSTSGPSNSFLCSGGLPLRVDWSATSTRCPSENKKEHVVPEEAALVARDVEEVRVRVDFRWRTSRRRRCPHRRSRRSFSGACSRSKILLRRWRRLEFKSEADVRGEERVRSAYQVPSIWSFSLRRATSRSR